MFCICENKDADQLRGNAVKIRQNITIFHLKTTIFTSMKNHGILHGCVIVMLTVVSCNVFDRHVLIQNLF